MRVREVFERKEAWTSALPGFEERPGQLDMAESVENALRFERALVVEAGTGTGKTLAYLLPAALSGRKVVISTATRALQEQLAYKDIPLARRLLEPFGVTFESTMMKGLSNYVCMRRLAEAAASENGPRGLTRILDWLIGSSRHVTLFLAATQATMKSISPRHRALVLLRQLRGQHVARERRERHHDEADEPRFAALH